MAKIIDFDDISDFQKLEILVRETYNVNGSMKIKRQKLVDLLTGGMKLTHPDQAGISYRMGAFPLVNDVARLLMTYMCYGMRVAAGCDREPVLEFSFNSGSGYGYTDYDDSSSIGTPQFWQDTLVKVIQTEIEYQRGDRMAQWIQNLT